MFESKYNYITSFGTKTIAHFLVFQFWPVNSNFSAYFNEPIRPIKACVRVERQATILILGSTENSL